MKFNKDNRGLSLVEMLVSVAILSIVMAGAFWMLSVMSKSFQQSQREVELQNSAQATYSLLSDFIQEAQKVGDGDSIVVSGNDTTIYTETTNPVTNAVSNDYFSLTLDENKLYLGENKSVSDIKGNDSYLLANNVSSYKVDTSTLNSGYVVLTVTCSKGTQSSTVSQNVFLRNSNSAANAEGQQGDDVDGYTLVSIKDKKDKTKYRKDQVIKLATFEFTGNWVKDDGSGETLTAKVPESMITAFYKKGDAAKTTLDGTKITSTIQAVFEFEGLDDPEEMELKITVSSDDPVVTLDTETLKAEDIKRDNISVNDDIKVTYYADTSIKPVCSKCGSEVQFATDSHGLNGFICKNSSCECGKTHWSTYKTYKYLHSLDEIGKKDGDGKYVTTTDADGKLIYYCNGNLGDGTGKCGKALNEMIKDGVVYYYCNNDQHGSCQYRNTNSNETGNAVNENYQTNVWEKSYLKTVYTASSEGKLVIRNESTTNDYSDVKVMIYLGTETDNVKFASIGGQYLVPVSGGFAKCDGAISYKVSSDAKFIELTLGSLPHATKGTNKDEGDYTTFTFTYKWTGAESGKTPPLCVWSEG